MAQTAEAGNIIRTNTTVKKRAKWRKYLPLTLMTLPGLLYLLINNYMPMFGIVIAFKDINISKGILGNDWVGFKNFEYLFKTSDAYIITRNTILCNAARIVLGTALSILFAILLNEIKSKYLARFYQSVILLPQLISIIIVSYLVYAFLSPGNGLLNKSVLPALGLSEHNWYFEKGKDSIHVTSTSLWKPQYTLNSKIGDLLEDPVGNTVLSPLLQALPLGGAKEASEMEMAMFMNAPIRTVILLSRGAITERMMVDILEKVNHQAQQA